MNRGNLTTLAVVLGVALVLLLGFFGLFERKEVSEPTGAVGAARYNRFLALEQSLQRMDVPVVSLATLDAHKLPLNDGDTVLFGGDVASVDVDDARRLDHWVRGGGHLVLAPGPAAAHTPLFEALGVLGRDEAGRGCGLLRAEGRPDKAGNGDVLLCGERFLLSDAADDEVDASIGDAGDGYLFARSWLDGGAVSLLADLDVISGNRLKQAAARQFAWRLLGPNLDQGTVYLVYALDGDSFLKRLFTRGWPALLSLGVLLAGWMAMRSARLGPLMPAPPPHRRALLEHVQAAGEFLYRRDGGRSLHALARDTVLARWRRRDPASAMLVGDELHQRLAERSGLDPAQVAQALQPPAHAAAFRTSIITLARLGSRP